MVFTEIAIDFAAKFFTTPSLQGFIFSFLPNDSGSESSLRCTGRYTTGMLMYALTQPAPPLRRCAQAQLRHWSDPLTLLTEITTLSEGPEWASLREARGPNSVTSPDS